MDALPQHSHNPQSRWGQVGPAPTSSALGATPNAHPNLSNMSSAAHDRAIQDRNLQANPSRPLDRKTLHQVLVASVWQSFKTQVEGSKIPGAGMGLLVEHSIPPGKEILRVKKPFVHAFLPGQSPLGACDYCMHPFKGGINKSGHLELDEPATTSGGVSTCYKCRYLWYCSESCKPRALQNGHGMECDFMRKNPDVQAGGTLSMIIRLLAKDQAMNFTQTLWRSFECLETHHDKFRGTTNSGVGFEADPGRWSEMQQLAQTAKLCSSSQRSLQEIEGLICRLRLGHMKIPILDGHCVDGPRSMFMVFHPMTAMINHSCQPNVVVVCENGIMCLRSIRAIGANEELTVSYIDSDLPLKTRRSQLLKNYFFNCHCSKCVEQQGADPDTAELSEFLSHSDFHQKTITSMVQSLRVTPFLTPEGLPDAIRAIFEYADSVAPGGHWPLTAHPFPQVLLQLAGKLQSRSLFTYALETLLLVVFDVMPDIHPSRLHIKRITSLFKLVMLMETIRTHPDQATMTYYGMIPFDHSILLLQLKLARFLLKDSTQFFGKDALPTQAVRNFLKKRLAMPDYQPVTDLWAPGSTAAKQAQETLLLWAGAEQKGDSVLFADMKFREKDFQDASLEKEY